MRSMLVVGVVFVLGTPTASSGVRSDDHWLVHNCPCNVGGVDSPESRDWYVQLGVFDDRDRADAFEEEATARGFRAFTYGAGWLNDRDALEDGPWVVVSRAFTTRGAAERALKRYRNVASDAMVRRFLTCPDEADEDS